jgi:hypothetical protein
VEIALPKAASGGTIARDLTRGMVQLCVESCHILLDWERSQLTGGTADAKQQQQHRNSLKWMLRLMRMLHAEASDPDYPDRTAAAELEAVIWKLQESWETFYNSMPEDEAERLLSEHFSGHGS